MKQWYSTQELEAMCLPGMPINRTHIVRKAQRESWKGRPRQGQGGGMEYHISSLPEAARAELVSRMRNQSAHLDEGALAGEAALLAREAGEASQKVNAALGMAAYSELPARMRTIVDARMNVLAAYDRFMKQEGARSELETAFIVAFKNQLLGLSHACYTDAVQREESISIATLKRWKRLLAGQGPAALVPQYGERSSREHQSVIDRNEEMQHLVLGLIYSMGAHVNAATIREAIWARFGDEETPSTRTIQRYIDRFRQTSRDVAKYVESPDVWRNQQRASLGRRDEGILRPNQLWEVDSTIADVALLERLPDGSEAPKRYSIVQVIDVWSRRVMFLVTRTSRAMAITLLFRRAMLKWGIPEMIRMDNGKDYASDQLSAYLAALQVRTVFCRPFQPQEKPHVERVFRTLQHSDMRLLPGFVGHSVPDQQKRRQRERALSREGRPPLDLGTVRMGPEEFQVWLDMWSEDIYARRRHEALGMSPFERVRSYRGTIVIPDEAAVAALLFPVPKTDKDGNNTVQKGGIRIGNVWYIAPELAGYVRAKVRCAYDPYDARRISVFNAETGAFICWAVDPETPEERRDIAIKARRLQEHNLKAEIGKLEKAARKANVRDVWMEIGIARSAEAAKVQMMPKAAELYTTPALEEAKKAMEAREKLDREPELRRENDPETRAKIHELNALQDKKKDPLERPEYWDDEVQYYLWCRKVATSKATLSQEDADFAAEYEELARWPLADRLFRRRSGDQLAQQ